MPWQLGGLTSRVGGVTAVKIQAIGALCNTGDTQVGKNHFSPGN